jgi:hypothetical protein
MLAEMRQTGQFLVERPIGSKREERSGFRATSEQSARIVCTGTDVPGKNRFSSDIPLLKGVNDVFCRATD